MANHWDLSDLQLSLMLVNWISWMEDGGAPPLKMWLFQNDIKPQPGVLLADFVEATFTGYVRKDIEYGSWEDELVVDHIASMIYSVFLDYTAGASGFSSQTIYGYAMVQNSTQLMWSESFAEPIVVVPEYSFKVKPRMRLKTEPNPL